jgi:hypothetical protein
VAIKVGGHADFLRPFIWKRVSGLMQFCDGSDKGTLSNFVQILEKVQTETIAMMRQVFGKDNLGQTKKGKTGDERSQ